MGLSAEKTGLLLFCSLAAGAGIDVAVAYLLRGLEGDRARLVTIQFLGGLATAAALLLVFSPVHGRATPFAYLIVALTLFRLAFAVYDVSQNALLSLLPQDEDDAHHYVVWRQTLTALARLAVAGLAFLVVGGARRGVGAFVVAAAIAVLVALTSGAMLRWKGAGSQIAAPLSSRTLPTPAGLPRLPLAGATLEGPLAMTVRVAPFVQPRGIAAFAGAAPLFALVLGTVVGPLALPRPGGDSGRAALGFTALAVLAAALFLADTRSGLFALAACFAHGVALGGLLALFWRAMSAAIRDHARRTGVNTDIAAFALLTATVKLSSAVFGVVLGLSLDGFKAGSPTAMIGLAAVIAAGGAGFLWAMSPGQGRRPRVHRGGAANTGSGRATPPSGSRTT